MPRTPRSRSAPRGDTQAPVLAMAVAVIVAAVAVSLLAIIVLGPILDQTGDQDAVGAIPGGIAAARVPILDPLAPTVIPTATARGRPTEPSATAAADQSQERRPGTGQPPTPGNRGSSNVAIKPVAPTERADPRPTRTPEPRATRTPTPWPPATVAPEPTREPDVIAYYLAEAGADLGAWSGPSWRADGATLSSDGSAVFAQPWISGPIAPPVTGGYALEAEIRIDGLASGYCKQSIGFIVPLPSGAFAGVGMIYECNASGAPAGSRVRISDVSDYTNGYFQDPEFAAEPLNLKSGWHTLRVEVDGDKVRLVIDGKLVLTASAGAEVAQNSASALGLWSEGVQVSIRRIAVVALETD